jgi:hypothetical protein
MTECHQLEQVCHSYTLASSELSPVPHNKALFVTGYGESISHAHQILKSVDCANMALMPYK